MNTRIKPAFIFLFLAFFPVLVLAQNMTQLLSKHARIFSQPEDLTGLIGLVADERLVLMGEASHGTSEYYTKRSVMSRQLVAEHGFNFIAVEGDWAAFSRINEYVKHKPGAPETLEQAMSSIDRWPLWMWRNHEFKALVKWLHEFNEDREMHERIGIYGIDVYAHIAAMNDVITWITGIDKELGQRAEQSYSCLTRHSEPVDYIQTVANTGRNCSADIQFVYELIPSLENHPEADPWQYFKARQGAKVAINAEKHYRANLERGSASWNYRASHFYLTTERLLEYYGEDSRGIVWAHNTHIGDARATNMTQYQMYNIGQLSRESLGNENVFAIGFGTYSGTVMAARNWDGSMYNMNLPEAAAGSWEHVLKQTDLDKFYLDLRDPELQSSLHRSLPHRAVGVIYNPENEQGGNYPQTVLPERYDAFVFIRETTTLSPLD